MAVRQSADIGYEKLRNDIASKKTTGLYVFYGEETYLRDYYINEIKKLMVDRNFEEFNFVKFEGSGTKAEQIIAAAECLPVMSETRIEVIYDYDIMRLSGTEAESILDFINNLPEYICVIFVYDTIEYKQDKKNKLCNAVLEKGTVVNFKKSDDKSLVQWIRRRFSSYGKKISQQDCEYLLFYSGNLMNTLISEIDKIALYAADDVIKRSDIEAACVKTLDTAIYELTDEIAAGRSDGALKKLRELLNMGYEPVVLSASIGKQIFKLYSARISIDEGRGREGLMRFWSIKSTYAADKLLRAASMLNEQALRKALIICGQADIELKSEAVDKIKVLENMLLKSVAVMKE